MRSTTADGSSSSPTPGTRPARASSSWRARPRSPPPAAGSRPRSVTRSASHARSSWWSAASLRGKAGAAERLADAIGRLQTYEAASADRLFAPGLADPEAIARVVGAVHRPLNVMAFAGVPPVKELERLGVARVSVGAGPMRATLALTRRIAEELLRQGTYQGFLRDTLSHAEVNGMFGRR